MINKKVTIAIPTYNRAELLKISLKSILEQDYSDFKVLVLDNDSTDNTNSVVRSFSDKRITYICNETNIGMFRNWNRAIELNTSSYLNIFLDDDVMLPGFINESVMVLDKYPNAAFSFAQAGGIDINGAHVQLPGDEPDGGVINGVEYLHRIVQGNNWVVRPSTVMMRASSLASISPFDIVHSKHSEDFNLYLRLAALYDIIFIPKLLCNIRIHAGQDWQRHFGSPRGTGPLATMAERTDAVAHLLKSVRAEEASYRQWLGDRLLYISMLRSDLTQLLLPELNLNWSERLEIAKQEISTHIPKGVSFILVDEDEWGSQIAPDCNVIPFLEHNGCSWGPPEDDETAIREFKRLWKSGASFIVFGRPAFWWLDYYSKFRDYLSSNFRCFFKNSNLIAYDLQQQK
jgi:glycosyltransferase involved in cell wall biosynthesis